MAIVKRFMILTFLVLFSCVSLCSCATHESFHKWKAESEYVPCVNVSMLDLDSETTVNMDKQLGNDYNVYEVLVIYNSRIYFLYKDYNAVAVEEDKQVWNLASMNVNDYKDIEICYSGEFGGAGDDFGSPKKLLYTNEYSDKSGFYYGGKIILNDKSRIIEYDIESKEVTEYNPGDFEYPKNEYHYTIQDDRQSILLTDLESGYEKLITIDDMANSTYGADLLKLKEETIKGSETLKTDRFFNNVQFINGEVYIICDVINDWGQSYALIFKYDVKNDKYEYVENNFLWGKFYYDFYLVRKVDTQ